MISMLEYLQNLLKGPIVGHLGTRDENHKVFRTIFFGASVLENPTRLVFYIPEAGMAAARKNLLIGDYAAALVVDATTFESIQIKGTVTSHTATDWEESNYKKQLERLRAYPMLQRYRRYGT